MPGLLPFQYELALLFQQLYELFFLLLRVLPLLFQLCHHVFSLLLRLLPLLFQLSISLPFAAPTLP